MRKTLAELKTINTKNLLRYYKAERDRCFTYKRNLDCWADWDHQNSITYQEWLDYLTFIKSELNTREHVERS